MNQETRGDLTKIIALDAWRLQQPLAALDPNGQIYYDTSANSSGEAEIQVYLEKEKEGCVV
jgi:hypothetical protein